MIKRFFSSALASLYAFCAVLTALIVVFLHGSTDFYLKDYAGAPLLGNLPLAVMAAVLVAAVIGLARRIGLCRIEHLLSRGGWKLMLALTALTMLAQIFVCYHVYFFSTWDARYVVESAHVYASGYPELIDSAYFTLYPNNLALVALYGQLGRVVNGVLGAEMGLERFVLLLILAQIAINAATGFVLWAFVRTFVRRAYEPGEGRSNCAAFGAWLLYLPLAACSPWFLIPYSDSTALLIPVLCLLLWLHRGEGRHALLACAAIGLLGGFGFLIKPQASIVLIGASILVLVEMVCETGRARSAAALRLGAMLLGAVLMIGPFRALLVKSTQVALDAEGAVGAAHFFNMGLNPQTSGAFNYDDLQAALAAPGEARTRWCLSSAVDRLEEMGTEGLMDHAVRKALINFSDGSFAWGVDFAMERLPEKDGFFSPLLREIVYSDGRYYPVLRTIQQFAWLLVLMLAPLAARGIKAAGKADSALLLTFLSALGILWFNMLFEAKARYVYLYAPVWIALAVFALALPGGICAWKPKRCCNKS